MKRCDSHQVSLGRRSRTGTASPAAGRSTDPASDTRRQKIAIRNGIEAGTHMIPAAICWSASAESPPGRRRERRVCVVDGRRCEPEHDGQHPADEQSGRAVRNALPVGELRPGSRARNEVHPHEQRRREEEHVLEVVREHVAQRQIVERGQMPTEQHDRECDERRQRSREPAPEPAQRPEGRSDEHRARDGPPNRRCQRLEHARPRTSKQKERRRHHRQQHVLCHVSPEQRSQ